MMDASARERMDTLVSKANAYRQRYEFIDNLTWPNGARIAVNFTADFDAMLFRRILNEPALQLAKGEFGGRVGIWRLIELFDSHAIHQGYHLHSRPDLRALSSSTPTCCRQQS